MSKYYWLGQKASIVGATTSNFWNDKNNWLLYVDGVTHGISATGPNDTDGLTYDYHYIPADKFPIGDDVAVFKVIPGLTAIGVRNTGIAGHSGGIDGGPLSACLRGGRENSGGNHQAWHPVVTSYWGHYDTITDPAVGTTYGNLSKLTIEKGYTYDTGERGVPDHSAFGQYVGLNLPVDNIEVRQGPLSPAWSNSNYLPNFILCDSNITNMVLGGEGDRELHRCTFENCVIYGEEFVPSDYPTPDPWPRGSIFLTGITCNNTINISGEYQPKVWIQQFDKSLSEGGGLITGNNTIPNINITAYKRSRWDPIKIQSNITNLRIYPTSVCRDCDYAENHIDGHNISVPDRGTISLHNDTYPNRQMTGISVENLYMYRDNVTVPGSTAAIMGDYTNPHLEINTKATFENVFLSSGIVFLEPDATETCTIVDGEIDTGATLVTYPFDNAFYEGFSTGSDKTEDDEGLLVLDPNAKIIFNSGMHVLSSHYTGQTGTNESLAKLTPGGK